MNTTWSYIHLLSWYGEDITIQWLISIHSRVFTFSSSCYWSISAHMGNNWLCSCFTLWTSLLPSVCLPMSSECTMGLWSFFTQGQWGYVSSEWTEESIYRRDSLNNELKSLQSSATQTEHRIQVMFLCRFITVSHCFHWLVGFSNIVFKNIDYR